VTSGAGSPRSLSVAPRADRTSERDGVAEAVGGWRERRAGGQGEAEEALLKYALAVRLILARMEQAVQQ